MKNNMYLIQFQMNLSFRNISFKTALRLFNSTDLSTIFLILSDSSIIDFNKDEQIIKYNFDNKNIVRVINPDVLSIYNKIVSRIIKTYGSNEDFVNHYEKNSTLIYSKIIDTIKYPIELVKNIVDDIYVNNSDLKKKKPSGVIRYLNIKILPYYLLYFYYKKSIYHIETINISRIKILESKIKSIFPEADKLEEKYKISIYDIINYSQDTLNKKYLYYQKNNNKPILESMKRLETYLWIKEMILREMSGSYKFIYTSSDSDTSASSNDLDLNSDEDE